MHVYVYSQFLLFECIYSICMCLCIHIYIISSCALVASTRLGYREVFECIEIVRVYVYMYICTDIYNQSLRIRDWGTASCLNLYILYVCMYLYIHH